MKKIDLKRIILNFIELIIAFFFLFELKIEIDVNKVVVL
jgi:hypothetical protein